MAWYEDIVAKNRYIYEVASDLAWDDAEDKYPLTDCYEFDEGYIYVAGWSSVDCAGDVIPIPDDRSSRPHKLVLKDEIVEKIAIDAGFRRGDWFWENVLENWRDFETEFSVRLRGCVPICDYERYVTDDFEKYSAHIQGWIVSIKDTILGWDSKLVNDFDKWLSKESNYRKLVDFLCSFDGYFEKLGDRLIDHIRGFATEYEDSFRYYIADSAARAVAENLADAYQLDFVKTCAQFYKDGGTIPGAVFVIVRDKVWEDFLASELGTEIANDDYEALEMIRGYYMEILTNFLDYPEDLVDVVGSLFVSNG
jgi:hypothetical protein